MTIHPRTSKFEFVDGLRGVAALQVVLLHYASAFLPVFTRAGLPEHFAWEKAASNSPLFVAFQGYVAVYVFFIMSGFVLAGSFLNSTSPIATQALKRSLRLYIPVAASLIIAALLKLFFHSAQLHASEISGSTWLTQLWSNDLSPVQFAKELAINSMLFGYGQSSIFSHIQFLASSQTLTPVVHSTNPPLWTLHLEFWGSIVLLMLASIIRSFPKVIARSAMLVLFVIAGTSFLSLFLIGFVTYLNVNTNNLKTSPSHSAVGLTMLGGGILLAFIPLEHQFHHILDSISWMPVMSALDAFQFQCEVSASLIFLGVLLCKGARELLSSRIPQWLGKISFSLYLTHFGILLTLGCAVFSWIRPFGYMTAVIASTSIGLTASLLIAVPFYKYVDRTSIRISRRVAQYRHHGSAVNRQSMER
ncbi:acyltransferase [Burkholderia diffusa]|uniref:acyltransferase family protein n=1 Tax=Burkholderia diffusa TaxID=488732 RepID=UPI002653AA90|nr:acyltransferase [Burkholderia diffusa]MDN7904909.1 acyltransferase [Burkholderia diffusa]